MEFWVVLDVPAHLSHDVVSQGSRLGEVDNAQVGISSNPPEGVLNRYTRGFSVFPGGLDVKPFGSVLVAKEVVPLVVKIPVRKVSGSTAPTVFREIAEAGVR